MVAMKHANCGGELVKVKAKPGRYRCAVCKDVVKIGRVGNYGGHSGYIKAQMRKL